MQGTINGIGERCGNANLVSLIPTLALKPYFADRFDIGIDAEKLKSVSRLSHAFDELLNRAPESQAPYVGSSAFATKAGIHASALIKDPAIAEGIEEIVLMGGAYFEVGNITPAAEFNIYVDPEAAAHVFASGIKLTVAPLDLTHKMLTAQDWIASLRAL